MEEQKKIIFVDDDPMFNFIHTKVIEKSKLNCKVHTFERVADVLTTIESIILDEPFDFPCIIFIDINMPTLDGWQFLELFSNMKPEIVKLCAVFMLSSSTDLSDIERAKTFPQVRGFISKPLTVQHALEIATYNYLPEINAKKLFF